MNSRERMIERWEQLIRVLRELPAHEKRYHFDMGTWIMETECGTVACAAGWAGLDPWFRRRGLATERNSNTIFPKRDPHDFFDSRGYYLVLLNTRPRSTGSVIREINRHIRWLRNEGDEWDEQYIAPTRTMKNPYDDLWYDYAKMRGRA